MIKPGQLVRIGEDHYGLVIEPAPYTPGFPDVHWWYVLMGEKIVSCLQSSLEIISDAR